MIKDYIFKDMDIKLLDMNKVFSDIEYQKFTGLLKLNYWDRCEILTFHRGRRVRLIKIFSDGRCVIENARGPIAEGESVASLIETDLDDLVSVHSFADHKIGDFPLFPYGEKVHRPVPFKFIRVEEELRFLREISLEGYMALYTPDKLEAVLVFHKGEPSEYISFGGKLSSDSLYMSVYSVEPELIPFLTSIKRSLETESFYSLEDAQRYVKETGSDAILYISAGSLQVLIFYFKGQEVAQIVKDTGVIVEKKSDKESLMGKAKNFPQKKIKVIKLDLSYEPKKVDVASIFGAKEEITVSPQVVEEIKKDFIRKVGPVGKILWNRALEELHISEKSITKEQIYVLIDKLKKEIPEEDLRNKFINEINHMLKGKGGG